MTQLGLFTNSTQLPLPLLLNCPNSDSLQNTGKIRSPRRHLRKMMPTGFRKLGLWRKIAKSRGLRPDIADIPHMVGTMLA